jgi:glyoxalase family protein
VHLEGVHHVTLITGDAPRNVDFYTRVLGLRLVKKTVNQDDPTVYHLFYADERGAPARTSRSSSTPARPAAARARG